ncbi:hypothetical protein AWB68_00516 [Caballeronia choica]|jgi:hypothetical protein|uniref:Uncharacterized protein n=1 Tax=Caballeronia choica TaxID=326476 RepID=A0A158FCU8_9BURK|nr:hypothetical protein [Caballeronia choica]SAL17668.1 hypothetical protein AWB68_00516 [Caballeronia choica]
MTQAQIRMFVSVLAALTTLTYSLSARPAMPEQEGADRNVADVSALNLPNDQASSDGVTTPAQGQPVAQVPTDPFVQRRNANAQANAEYRASKKTSKQQMEAVVDDAKALYDEEVANAKINRKADRNAAMNELKASEPERPKDTEVRH